MPASTGMASASRLRTYVVTTWSCASQSLLRRRTEVHQETGVVPDVLQVLVPDLEVDELVDHCPWRVVHDERLRFLVQRVTLRIIRLTRTGHEIVHLRVCVEGVVGALGRLLQRVERRVERRVAFPRP